MYPKIFLQSLDLKKYLLCSIEAGLILDVGTYGGHAYELQPMIAFMLFLNRSTSIAELFQFLGLIRPSVNWPPTVT